MTYTELLSQHYEAFLFGAGMTALVSATSIALGMGLGLLLSFALLSRNPAVRHAAGVYRSIWRGTPILVQLLIVYYLLPELGLDAPPLLAAIAALTLNTAAFQAEIFRAGLITIPKGQAEAAWMLGIGTWSIRRRILIPQMLRAVLPALVNETISILKNSSLISVIAVTDLMRTSQQVVSVTYRPLDVYMIAAVIYLAMNLLLARAGTHAEAHFSKSARARP